VVVGRPRHGGGDLDGRWPRVSSGARGIDCARLEPGGEGSRPRSSSMIK
jgi:hypothetical protein